MKKTVYFLGAGASAGSDFKLPTMEGFFREEDFQDVNYPKLKEFIETLYPNTPFKNINLEDVITHLELSLEGFGGAWEPFKILEIEARQEISKYLLERLSLEAIKNDQKPCNKHLKLFEKSILRLDTF
jgi:hypothetical protein